MANAMRAAVKACAAGEQRGSTALPDPTLRPLPPPFNVPLVLDHNQPRHHKREKHGRCRRTNLCGDDGKVSKGRQCAIRRVAAQGDRSSSSNSPISGATPRTEPSAVATPLPPLNRKEASSKKIGLVGYYVLRRAQIHVIGFPELHSNHGGYI